MTKALIFHGTMGSPAGNWFGWLQEELMIDGWQVAVPAFPTPEGQSLDAWKTALAEKIPAYQDVNVVIGHSLGATFALRLLEQNLINPQKIILVSSVIKKINNEEYDALNHSFIHEGFDWDKIKQGGADITLVHGDDDPYVPLGHTKELADHLNTPLNVMPNGGHLNTESGYDQFPEILDFLE